MRGNSPPPGTWALAVVAALGILGASFVPLFSAPLALLTVVFWCYVWTDSQLRTASILLPLQLLFIPANLYLGALTWQAWGALTGLCGECVFAPVSLEVPLHLGEAIAHSLWISALGLAVVVPVFLLLRSVARRVARASGPDFWDGLTGPGAPGNMPSPDSTKPFGGVL